jgi:hypothetical protein
MGQPFVVQLPNRPGELAHLAQGLCDRGVNIHQIQGSAAGDLGCALIYTDNDEITRDVLEKLGLSFVTGGTLLVDLDDTPGALGDLTRRLEQGGVQLSGCCVVGRHGGRVEWSLSLDNDRLARKVLGMPAGGRSKATRPSGAATATSSS